MADHDEHIRHTVARLAWAYNGPPSQDHGLLTAKPWCYRDSTLHNRIAFFHDGQFVNYAQVLKTGNELEAEGDWRLDAGRLTMTVTETNLQDADFLWKDMEYTIDELSSKRLWYTEDDGTQYRFQPDPNQYGIL